MTVPTTAMSRIFSIFAVIFGSVALLAAWLWFTGLSLHPIPPPMNGFVGTVSDTAIDPARRDFFAPTRARVVPFQILYPASAPGRTVAYVPYAKPVTQAIERNQGRLLGMALNRIGKIAAPWTLDAHPRRDGPYPVVIYLPGVTGYMEMSSFQTAPLAADGFVVVTLNQPGVVAAARLPDGNVVQGMSRDEAVQLVTPSYRHAPLPPATAARLAPETSIVPYLAADIPAVIARLSAINGDPRHPLHGLLDLQKIGVMGVSLGAIVAAQVCQSYDRVKACLMMDAPVPTAVADAGLRKPALWLSRPAIDQRAERAASGGWPEQEIAAQATSIARVVSNSREARVVTLRGLFHVDFTDLPTIQPVIGWLGMTGSIGTTEAHDKIVKQTIKFFREKTAPNPLESPQNLRRAKGR